MKEQQIICFECKNEFKQIPKRSFLGFFNFKCPNCNQKILYPLSTGYRITYWVLIVLSIKIGRIIGLASIIALIKDFSIKRKIKKVNKA